MVMAGVVCREAVMPASEGPPPMAGSLTVPAGGLVTAWCKVPHPEKAHKGGEDEIFAAPASVGVADGVGGWAERGVDPAEYSRALMAAAADTALLDTGSSAQQIMAVAAQSVERAQVVGSATACVGALLPALMVAWSHAR